MSFAPGTVGAAPPAAILPFVEFLPAGPDEAWLVAHTRPRCEKKFAAQLTDERLPHFLPLVTSVRPYPTGAKRFRKPLFPGYVFVCAPDQHRMRLHARDHLARVLRVPDEPRFLQQLAQVRAIVESGYTVATHPILIRGTRVRVTSGPLRDLEGIVQHTDKVTSIVVAMDVLQQGARVQIPATLLRAVA